jgi:hypothetical protein
MSDPVTTQLIIAAVTTAASMAISALQKFEGPRLTDLNATTADYGTPLPVIWGRKRVECPIFYAEELRETKTRRKTKGGKYNDYTYSGTWAVFVSDAPIDSVLRIWFDRHLVYDATGTGPKYPFQFTDQAASQMLFTIKFGLENNFLRIYTGSETQEPDPRMELGVEAATGAGSCPAYRGVSYVMFEDVPLEKFGNRMPQVSVEATTLGTAIYPFEKKPFLNTDVATLAGATLDVDGSTLFWAWQDAWERWDLFSLSRMGGGPLAETVSDLTVAMQPNGDFYTVESSILRKHIGPGYVTVDDSVVLDSDGLYAVTLRVDLDYFVGVISGNFNTYSQLYSIKDNQLLSKDEGFTVKAYVTDGTNNIWVIGCPEPLSALPIPHNVEIRCIYGLRKGASATVPSLSNSAGVIGMTAIYYPKDNSVIVCTYDGVDSKRIMKIDLGGLSLIENITFLSNGRPYNSFLNWRGGESIWILNTNFASEYSLDDLTVLRTLDFDDWAGADGAAFGMIHIPAVSAFFSGLDAAFVAGGNLTMRYIDRFTGNGVTLESICDDVAERVAAPACDFTAFSDIIIPGFAFTQGPAKAILEPLIEIHDADVRPHDFGLQGVLRGSASGATIDVAFMVPEGGERYTITRAVDTDLPQTVVLTFSDVDKDQQPNTAQSFKRGSDSVRNLTLDASTYATDVDSARLLADRHLRRRWYGAERYKFSVGRRSLALEPGDVVTGGFDGMARTMKLNKVIIGANGIAEVEGERDTPAIAVLGTAVGAPADGQVEDSIRPAGLTNGFVLDLPLAADSHDQPTPFLYYAAGPYDVDAFWPGADFAVSEDGASEYAPGWASIASTARVTAGYTTTELPDADASILDRASSLTIQLQSGTLTSCTEEELLQDETRNLAAIGAELVQFTTATLGAGDSYTLSGFRRGVRGTEQHTGTHVAGDRFMVLDANVFRRTVSAAEVGDTDYYIATTQGRSGGTPQTLLMTAAAQRPYSPVHGVLTLAAGDWTINATRRTRIGGFNVDGISPPLGETAEMWEADILDGADVVRTLTGTSLPLTYTAAMQTADFGGAQTSLDVMLYQISPALSLRGFPLALAA